MVNGLRTDVRLTMNVSSTHLCYSNSVHRKVYTPHPLHDHHHHHKKEITDKFLQSIDTTKIVIKRINHIETYI